MNSIRTSLFAAALALGGFALAPSTAAQAGDGFRLGFAYGDVGHRGDRGYRHGRGFRGDRARGRGRCRPRRALRKARDFGLRRAYIHRAGPRGVVVRGRARGERLAVRFGRARNCPVVVVRRRGW